MKYPVRLFLGNEEVEFSTPPEILFNYTETELTNPTIVKNSYTKTITIEGTQNNNKLFGHIYNLERLQGTFGTLMGSSFNPMVKTDFTLYYNGSIYESGYFKLDEIRRNNNNIEYDITLYGGLGDFFYNLSYNEDGSSMELAVLTYNCELEDYYYSPQDLGFTINKETVKEAWDYIESYGSKWYTINFAPCYNGIPSNFSADKFLINNRGYGTTFGASTGYSFGTSEHEHTEWETFDLRSYLQRPVLRCSEVIKACANPENNGGYTVNLDEDFFTTDNPYYDETWMTLPMLTELDVEATNSIPITVTALTPETDYVYGIWSEMGNATNVQFDLKVKFTPFTSEHFTGSSVYLTRSYWSDGGVTLRDDLVQAFCSDSFITLQMFGYNSSNEIAATSDLFYLCSYLTNEAYFHPDAEFAKEKFNGKQPVTTVNNVNVLKGKFAKKNGQYIWSTENGSEYTLKFKFPSDAPEITQIKLKIVFYNRRHTDRTWWGADTNTEQYDAFETWSSKIVNETTYHDTSYVWNLDKVQGDISFVPQGITGTTTAYEGFYSNRTYSKKDLLTLGVTPAQFLLSYAKIFGLYFIKDVESKTIDILTRHNFYKRDNIVNINDLVDKGSDINITPCSAKYQYYDLGFEQIESEAAEKYKKTYGVEYGTQVINTGYQFEKQHKQLLDKNIFKGAVNVLEKNKYFFKPTNGIPCLVYNGFSYTYPDGQGGTSEGSITPKVMTGATLNEDGLKYYDLYPKPQFYKDDHAGSDGAFVLLMCLNESVSTSGIGYHLTDDTSTMYVRNDGQPCWIMTRYTADTSGYNIALDVNSIPKFARDVYSDGRIRFSMDIGKPLTTYVPNTYATEFQNIYTRGWKTYISDLYNENTRVLKCRCLLRERPNPEWLRRFYWFDNSYWRLNSIKDWNISSFSTTEMEFIKVQDIDNYDNIIFSIYPFIEVKVLNTVGAEGGNVNIQIYISDAGGWNVGDLIPYDYEGGDDGYWETDAVVYPSAGYGRDYSTATITVPANVSAETRTIGFGFRDGYDRWHFVDFEQPGGYSGNSIVMANTVFKRAGGTGYAVVSSSGNWTLTYPSWAVPSPSSGGPGETEIMITVSSTVQAHRTGTISIDNAHSITIDQYGGS